MTVRLMGSHLDAQTVVPDLATCCLQTQHTASGKASSHMLAECTGGKAQFTRAHVLLPEPGMPHTTTQAAAQVAEGLWLLSPAEYGKDWGQTLSKPKASLGWPLDLAGPSTSEAENLQVLHHEILRGGLLATLRKKVLSRCRQTANATAAALLQLQARIHVRSNPTPPPPPPHHPALPRSLQTSLPDGRATARR